jgi:hypothetical protein
MLPTMLCLAGQPLSIFFTSFRDFAPIVLQIHCSTNPIALQTHIACESGPR